MRGLTETGAKLFWVVLALPAATQASDKAAFLDFKTYPRARFLCQEFVRSKELEIHWRSFAIPDPPAKVVAFYTRQHGKPARDDKNGFSWRLPSNPNAVLTVYAAAHNDDFPHCAEKPQRGEQTVVLTSAARAQ
jgi:hypothetical protein